MEAIFSQIPKDLPVWAWILIILIVSLTIYFVAKISGKSKRQSNNITRSNIRGSKIVQKNIDKDKD